MSEAAKQQIMMIAGLHSSGFSIVQALMMDIKVVHLEKLFLKANEIKKVGNLVRRLAPF